MVLSIVSVSEAPGHGVPACWTGPGRPCRSRPSRRAGCRRSRGAPTRTWTPRPSSRSGRRRGSPCCAASRTCRRPRARCSRGCARAAVRPGTRAASRRRPARPGSSSDDSATRRAVSSGTSEATRTGSNREPGRCIERREDLRRLHAEEVRQAPRDVVALGERQVGRRDLHGPGGDVVDERAALPVVDQAAGRGNRLILGPLCLGADGCDVAIRDLEVGEASRQQSRTPGS